MAINVNKVYRTVLSILNKEQRGYLTPDQFNRLGRQAQLDLFEKSFYDYNRHLTRRNMQGVNSDYGDIASNIEEKIDLFLITEDVTNIVNGSFSESALDNDLYRTVQLLKQDGITEIEKVKRSEFAQISSSKLTSPSESYPIYYYSNGEFKISPASLTACVIDYIRQPEEPKWDFDSSNGTYIFKEVGAAGSLSKDFELHPSEETDLIIKILAYAGVVIKDPTIIQVAQNEEVKNINQENS